MKLTILLVTITVLSSFAVDSYSQTARLTLKLENSTIKNVLKEIENQSEFRFFYSGAVDVEANATIALTDKNIMETLDQLFAGTGIHYEIYGRQVALMARQETALPAGIQQQAVLSGRVTDRSGFALPGVTVVVKGTTTGTITDNNGNYSLRSVPSDATLVFSFVGMRTQEVVVGNQTTINIVLDEEAIGIEEVVAIGYGTVRRSDLTGAVSQVTASDFERVPATTPLISLQGRAPGLQIVPNSGEPGATASIRIRGEQSISGTNAPIFVVDGIITTNINNLNPQDIESISVLKDASVVAIYGSRASNGVILVTTKRGDTGREPTITFNTYQGVQTQSNLRLNLLNAEEWLGIFTEAYNNAGITPPGTARHCPCTREWTPTGWAPYNGQACCQTIT